jgi:hypothetical protein
MFEIPEDTKARALHDKKGADLADMRKALSPDKAIHYTQPLGRTPLVIAKALEDEVSKRRRGKELNDTLAKAAATRFTDRDPPRPANRKKVA